MGTAIISFMSDTEFRQFQEQLAESARQATELAPGRFDDTAAQVIRGLAYLAKYTAEMSEQVVALNARVAALEERLSRARPMNPAGPATANASSPEPK